MKILDESKLLYYTSRLKSKFLSKASVGTAGGVASLGSDGKVPSNQMPAMNYIPTSQKGMANGVASLGSDGKILSSQLPQQDAPILYKEKTVTLSASSWSNNSQTVRDSEIVGKPVFVKPSGTSFVSCMDNGVYPDDPVNDTITFHCEDVPSETLVFNMIIFGAN